VISTAAVVVSLVSALAISLIGWALCLALGLRWARAANVTTLRICVATAIAISAQIALNVAFVIATISAPTSAIAIGIAELAASVVIPCAVIVWIFRIRPHKAFLAWLPTLLVPLVMAGISVLLVRPFLYEAYTNVANNMAPTILGKHYKGTCPRCGQANFSSATTSLRESPENRTAICIQFDITETLIPLQRPHGPDRFLIAKFMEPRRWDIVVLRRPDNPSALSISRLVGLPGETIHIEDGAVWANGNRLTPPSDLQGIQYLDRLPETFRELWGSKGQEAVLGEDEYFVLGDFSSNSLDSRLWERGAPDHNPYALPKSCLRGVVTHIYWPPQRWRVFR
jgi:signal peptidase I